MGTITLPNVPATSDITSKVRLKYGGMPIDFRTLTDIKALVYSDAQKALAGRCVTTIEGEEGEILSCLYTATKPQYPGPNRIIVQAKYHGQTNTYDKLAFNIVRRLDDVATESVEVEDNSAEMAIEVDVTIEITEVTAGLLDRGIAAAFDAADKAEHAASLVPLQVLQDCEEATADANQARDAANAAAAEATEAAGRAPYIGENGNWFIWNAELGEYVDSGVKGREDVDEELSESSVNPVENRVVKAAIDEKYTKPGNGIPKTDMVEEVQKAINFAAASASRPYDSQNPNGMGYLVLEKDKTIASQVTEANTIYEIRNDFDLTQDLVLPSGSRLLFNGGTINPNGHTISGAIANEYLMPEWFGAKGDGITDDSDSFNAVVSLVNGGSSGRICLQKKHYIVKNSLVFKTDFDFNGNGATMEFSGTASYACIKVKKDNSISLLDCGTVSGSKNDSFLTVSDPSGINAGDYLLIYDSTNGSWSAVNTNYHAGDIVKVKEVNGTTVSLADILTRDYSGAGIALYKMNIAKVSISDLTIIGHCDQGNTLNTQSPINVTCCVDSSFKNLILSGSNTTHLIVNQCYGVVIDNVKVDYDSVVQDVNLNYGITIGSSKKVIVGNCILKTGRHGITIGGGENYIVPNRYIHIHDCILDTYSTANYSADSHTNAEFVSFVNNEILGGIDCCASFFRICGNRIFSKKGLQCAVFLANSRYRTGEISGNEIHWNCETNGDCGINIYTNQEADATAELLIKDNTFFRDSYNTGVTSQCADIYVRNGVTYKYKSISVIGNHFPENPISLCLALFAKDSMMDSFLFKQNDCNSTVQLNQTSGIIDAVFSGNRFKQSGGSNVVVNAASRCFVEGNTFENDTYPFTANATTQNEGASFIITRNTFRLESTSNGRGAIYVGKASLVSFVMNVVYNITSTYWNNDAYLGTITKAVILGNKYSCTKPVRLAASTDVTTIVRESGETAKRPAATAVEAGFQYFSTDDNKTVVSTGTAWVNMDGTALS